jgi:membrane-bound lytic murein transglycosylase D
MRNCWNRYRLLALAALALSLAGCDPSRPASAPERQPAQATAPALPVPPPQAARPVAPALPPPLTREEQRVRLLIQQVDQAYAFGEAAYRKGNLAEAKVEFDRAVDLMLTSGIDIKGDSRLQDEFDRIVDGVNAMEMEALKQGDGFVPKVEPSPAEVASDVTFEVDPNIVARAKTQLATTKSDLPLVVNDYVAAYINFFANTQKGHNTLLHSFQRAGRYKAMIQRVMAEEGVPQDLIYLAVAESGFQPRALNRRSGAGGMWQFMPHGDYGLARSAYLDERFDPEKIDARLCPLHEVHLRPVGRLVPFHGCLRLGRGQCTARRAEDGLRRLLGAVQTQQPARRDQELRSGDSGGHHYRQSSHAVWI